MGQTFQITLPDPPSTTATIMLPHATRDPTLETLDIIPWTIRASDTGCKYAKPNTNLSNNSDGKENSSPKTCCRNH